MGGLGNGRRGGRSPPLMIAALIACILVLGFNYWVSSSRNLELQTKLYELESQVRRGVAERGIEEMKKKEFQEEIERQKEQISHIEILYKRQLEGAENTCSQYKATLQQNISSSAKTIQELKGQLNQLNDVVGKLQKELQGCRGNIKTLNDKFMYDMTQCNAQVLSQKEMCDERVAAVKLEVEKKMQKLIHSAVPSQENTVDRAVEDKSVKPVSGVHATVVSHTPSLSHPKRNEANELLTNEVTVNKVPSDPVEYPTSKDLSKAEPQAVPSDVELKQDSIQPKEGAAKGDEVEAETSKLVKNNLTKDKGMEVIDTHEEGPQREEADPGMEGMLIGQGKVDETQVGQKLQEPDEYDADEQVVGGEDLEKSQQNTQAENIDKVMEDELADYNGDDENEGEFEADKQAELAQN
ncbi:Golgi membrane protein 1 isoform X2 [Archocentrus centrarchus]|uniref:Golgi membrane protein 1 isoform X2 n=1 Tax=Archocentrus centrarchus TaxID=63155 RepID=UPI0011EA241B|nr:Golgi membrane protein 1 isoform X2 [Archocentrus centrarchus]